MPIAFRAEGGMSDVENDPQYKGWKRIYEVNPDASGFTSYILFQPLYCGSFSTSDIPPSALNAIGIL